jgi:hypothetical protein
MAESTKKIEIECPNCKKGYQIDVPKAEFEKCKQKGIVTIALVAPCGHACQIFVDPRWKYRGGQAADIVLESGKVEQLDAGSRGVAPRDERADLVHKIASEIIVMDARDHSWIKAMGAEEKVEIAELALLTGDKDAAKGIFSDLAEFAGNIDDEEFSASMNDRIARIDLLFKPGESIDYAAVLDEVQQATTGSETTEEKNRRIDRLDAVLVDLKLANITGDVSNEEYEYKKGRLLKIKEKLT